MHVEQTNNQLERGLKIFIGKIIEESAIKKNDIESESSYCSKNLLSVDFLWSISYITTKNADFLYSLFLS